MEIWISFSAFIISTTTLIVAILSRRPYVSGLEIWGVEVKEEDDPHQFAIKLNNTGLAPARNVRLKIKYKVKDDWKDNDIVKEYLVKDEINVTKEDFSIHNFLFHEVPIKFIFTFEDKVELLKVAIHFFKVQIEYRYNSIWPFASNYTTEQIFKYDFEKRKCEMLDSDAYWSPRIAKIKLPQFIYHRFKQKNK